MAASLVARVPDEFLEIRGCKPIDDIWFLVSRHDFSVPHKKVIKLLVKDVDSLELIRNSFFALSVGFLFT